MSDSELEHLRVILARANEPPPPGKLKASLREVGGRLKKKVRDVIEKNWSSIATKDAA
jgi:hypothetical protein